MILENPLGALEFWHVVEGADLLPSEISYTIIPLEPDIPEGMVVQKLTAVLVRIMPEADRGNVRIGFRWIESLGISGDPQSGERLDAMAWEKNGQIVTVGTEDYDALASRLPDLGLAEANYPVIFSPEGMEVVFPHIARGLPVSLHFIMAINASPERVECSSWYAVDVPHRKLLATVVEG